MTLKINHDPADALYLDQKHVWQETLSLLLQQGADVRHSMKAADEAAKAFRKRFSADKANG